MTESNDPLSTFVEQVAKSITPVRHKVLVALAKAEEKTAGGVYLADETRDREHTAEICGMVIGLGPDAFDDKKRFPSGPSCKIGDWVIFRSYGGTRIFLKDMPDQEFRVMNDDEIEGLTTDPGNVRRWK